MSSLKFQIGPWSDLLTQIQTNGSETILAGKKHVFLYICANWSLTCRKVESETLSDPRLSDFLNENFLNIRILMGIIPEADTRRKLKESLNINVENYPACVFLDHDGTVINYSTGDLTPNDLINAGKAALDGRIAKTLETRTNR